VQIAPGMILKARGPCRGGMQVVGPHRGQLVAATTQQAVKSCRQSTSWCTSCSRWESLWRFVLCTHCLLAVDEWSFIFYLAGRSGGKGHGVPLHEQQAECMLL
jgi:hypothetical protein